MNDRAQIVAGWLLVAGFVAVAAALVDYHSHVRLFQAAWLMGFAGFGLVVRALWRLSPDCIPGRWSWWLIGFALLRIGLLHTAPSDDVYRYVWEGKIQQHGFNPYTTPPTDERLRELGDGDANRPLINHPNYPAIYPPLAQLLFRVTSGFSNSVYVTKAVLVGLEILGIVLIGYLLRSLGLAPHRCAVYALCPLSLTAFGIEGHLDPLMLLCLMAAAIYAMRLSYYACAVALGLAIASKLVCVVLLPWLAVKKTTAAVLTVAVVAGTYLPFADAGMDVFASLIRFGETNTNLALFVGPFGAVFGGQVARWGCGLALVVFVGCLAWRRLEFSVYATRTLAGLILFMPVVHVWYLTWFLAFSWSRLRVSWLVLAASMVFYFEAERNRAITGTWQMPLWVSLCIYTPFLAALAIEAARKKRRSEI